jgi:uncharacterized protein DUF4160
VPTIVAANGFAIRILTNDHRPAHVHCFKAGKTTKIEIAGPPVITSTTMSYRDANDVLKLVTAHLALLRRQWKKYHGSLR